MRLEPGTVVGGYLLQERLGSGGCGAVYLAKHPRLERSVALKVLHPGYATDPAVRRSFDREARIIAKLEHPNIVAVYDRNGPDDEFLWLSMRHIVGGDLAAATAAQPSGLDPQRIARLIADVARGLDYAHRNGVLHRDVKPANILAEQHPDGERAILTDFGIARALDATITASGVTATLAYAAPERFARGSVDRRADVYSLGCTLFHLLTGHTPFDTTDPASAISAHLTQSPPSPRDLRPELPSNLDQVIATALAKDPDHRYPTCTELAEDLARAVTTTTEAPASAPPKDEHRRARPPRFSAGLDGAVKDHDSTGGGASTQPPREGSTRRRQPTLSKQFADIVISRSRAIHEWARARFAMWRKTAADKPLRAVSVAILVVVLTLTGVVVIVAGASQVLDADALTLTETELLIYLIWAFGVSSLILIVVRWGLSRLPAWLTYERTADPSGDEADEDPYADLTSTQEHIALTVNTAAVIVLFVGMIALSGGLGLAIHLGFAAPTIVSVMAGGLTMLGLLRAGSYAVAVLGPRWDRIVGRLVRRL